MKKIILALMMMVSVSFAYPTMYGGKYIVDLTVVEANKYIVQRYSAPCGGESNKIISASLDSTTGYYTGTYAISSGSYWDGWNEYTCTYDIIKFKLADTPCSSTQHLENGICVNNTPTCSANEFLLNDQCFPVCPAGQTNSSIDGKCVGTCSTGSHWDNNISTPACVGDSKYGYANVHASGAYHVLFEDGALMYCRTDGKCLTTALNGEVIPNRWYEGSIPEAPNVYSDIFNEALTVTGNLLGKTLQFAGYTIGLSASGFGLLLPGESPVSGVINPGALAGAGLVSLGNLLVTNDEKIITTPTENGVLNVDIVTKASTSSESFDSVAAKTPSDGSASFSPNGIYTYKQITEANLKTVWDNAAGVGKMPPNALVLGSDIIFPTNNPNTAIVNSPTQIEVVKTNPDNSAQSVVINKADLANTVNNGTDLPYVAKDYKAPIINNDGTVTQAVTATPSTTSLKTNNTTSTNPTTGQTTTANAANTSGTANSSNGISTDLSGVTGRLDQLGKQLEKGNGLLEKENGLLDDIKKHINDGEVTATTHGIPTDTSSGDWNSYSQAWENIKSSFSDVNSKVSEVQGLFQNGFQVNLVGGAVATCAYTATVDFGYFNIPFEFDPCITASQYRNVFYTFFYLLFVIGILSFSVKSFLRLA